MLLQSKWLFYFQIQDLESNLIDWLIDGSCDAAKKVNGEEP